jgi:hypothetical protein
MWSSTKQKISALLHKCDAVLWDASDSLIFRVSLGMTKSLYHYEVGILYIIIQFFIIYVPSQQLQGQLQTQYSVDRSNYIMGKHNRQITGKHWRKNTLIHKSIQSNNNNNNNNKYYYFITRNLSWYWELRNVKYKYLERLIIQFNNNKYYYHLVCTYRVLVGSRVFISPCRPDRLWGSPNLLYNEYRGLFPGGKAAGAWSRPLTSN